MDVKDHKEGWGLKNWCFKTMVLEKTLGVPWTARRLNQSILNEINPGYSLEVLILKLKLQYFGHLKWRATHWKRPWWWEKLKAGEGDDRGWDCRMASLTQWTWVWASSGSFTKHREAWHATVHGVSKSRTWLSNWTATFTVGYFKTSSTKLIKQAKK